MDKKSIDAINSNQSMKDVLNDMASEIADLKTRRENGERTKQTKDGLKHKAKRVLKEFIREGGAGNKESFQAFAERKALDTGVSGEDTIEAEISRELNELAIANQVILSQFRAGSRPNGAPYTIPKIAQRPNVVRTLENRSGTVVNPTDNQTYTHTSADFAKSMSMPAFTHEIIQDAVRDVEADALRLIGEERAFDFIAQALFGDGTQDPDNSMQLRGLLTSRIDSDNNYDEAVKEDAIRDPEFLQVQITGTENALPEGDDLVNFLIDVQSDLPFKYQGNAAWYVSRATFAILRKLRIDNNANSTDSRSLLVQDYGTLDASQKGTSFSMMGKPVYIVDQLDETAGTTNDIPLFYGDLTETLEFGMISGSEHFLVDEYTVKGQKLLYSDIRFFSVLHNNDALRVVVATDRA
ncbi:phage major capsid protein [Vibrio coralliilyticus]|uniref:phage major capsid protein n=1 Tax=Vibrio coralliilyticus TaxID=190893 RepID=UPI00155FED05|nr:phage major capsid protein [Vibrio coralliilyticus]NRF16615.1 phage major capsid protein [Vibrio coralliilyticus]